MEAILNQFHDVLTPGMNPQVCRSYRNEVREFLKICEITTVKQLDLTKASEFDPLFIKYIEYQKKERQVKFKTIERKFSALGKFFSFLVRYDYITMDPVSSFREWHMQEYKDDETEMRMLPEPKEVKTVLRNCITIKDFFMVLFFAKTGARRQEVIDADIEDLNLEKKIWYVKPHAKRTGKKVPLDDELIEVGRIYLKTRTDDCPALFIGKYKRRINKDRLREDLTDIFRKVGMYKDGGKLEERLTPHCFRHFQNTQLDLKGLPKGFLKEIRGDQREKGDSCERYIHYNEKNLVKVCNQYKINLIGKSMRLPRK